MTSTYDLDERWHITGHLNGGYLAAVCGEIASQALGGAAPFTISTHYLAPARGGGPADVEVDVLREGRLSTARVRLSREGVLLLESLVTTGTPKAHDALREDATPPDIPVWDDLPSADSTPFSAQPGNEVLAHVDLRLDPGDAAALSGGAPLDRAVARGRMVYRDGSPADLFLASAAWDLLPPTPWFVHVWTGAPTVAAQLVLYPGDIQGPLILESRAETIREGIADETARVWDARGHLVVSSRQTAIIT